MSYQIGPYGFIRWEGPPPPLVKQHVTTFNKIGQAGISAQLTGIHGDYFEVSLSAAFANQAAAIVADESYRDLIGAAPQELIFNGIDYLFAFQHTYLVTAIDTTRMKSHPLLIGPGYSYPGGYLVQTRWQMVPITTT